VAEGTLHKALLGDPYTVRRVSADAKVAEAVAARWGASRVQGSRFRACGLGFRVKG